MSGDETLRVVLLMAVHNRRDSTVAALHRFHAIAPTSWRIRVHITDDGSTDGTAEAVAALPYDIHLIRGDGSWYWTRSMYRAQQTVTEPFDVEIWHNDDSTLCDDALLRLDQWHRRRPEAMFGGRFIGPDGTTLFGGRRARRWRIGGDLVLGDAGEPVPVDYLGGNLLLIPRSVRERIGGIDAGLSHYLGDVEYGYRARRAGVPVLVMPGVAGTHAAIEEVRAPSARAALRALTHDPLRARPRERVHVLRRLCGWQWPIAFVAPYAAIALGYRPMIRVPYAGSTSAARAARWMPGRESASSS